MNEGQRLLVDLRLSAREIGQRVGVSRQTANAWRTGAKRPSAHHRACVEAAFPHIVAEAWDARRDGAESLVPLTTDAAFDIIVARLERALRNGPSALETARLSACLARTMERRERIEAGRERFRARFKVEAERLLKYQVQVAHDVLGPQHRDAVVRVLRESVAAMLSEAQR